MRSFFTNERGFSLDEGKATALAVALLFLTMTCVDNNQIVIPESLYTTITCTNLSERLNTCTGSGNLLIPTHLELNGRKLKKVEIDSILFDVNFMEEQPVILYSMIFSFRTSNSHLFSIPFSDQLYTKGAKIKFNFDPEQLELLATTLMREHSVIVTFGIRISGVTEQVDVRLNAIIKSLYE